MTAMTQYLRLLSKFNLVTDGRRNFKLEHLNFDFFFKSVLERSNSLTVKPIKKLLFLFLVHKIVYFQKKEVGTLTEYEEKEFQFQSSHRLN